VTRVRALPGTYRSVSRYTPMTIKQEALDIEPTEEQMRKIYEAWEKGGKEGLKQTLREQNQELRKKKKQEKK
jgi:hypothetical protein